MDSTSEKSSVRFLSFTNDKEDAEKDAKLREAAETIEQAITKQKALDELIDAKIPTEEEAIDLANDTRPLFERLLEQRNKKQEALEESQKFSNLVTKLDEDDVDYLNSVAKAKQEEEVKKRLEIYDVMEEKKRLNETRILEEEKLMKQSLLGSKMLSKSSPLKSKLSSLIRVKPKVTPKPANALSQSPDDSEQAVITLDTVDDQSDGRRQTRGSSKRNAQHEDSNKGGKSSEGSQDKPNDDGSAKRQKISGQDENKSDDGGEKSEPNSTGTGCCCPNDIMKCIGVLPSLPNVEEFHESDSENSDDDLDRRIVPQIGGRK